MANVTLNSNPVIVQKVREGLKRRNGFCPCRAEDKPEYRCMCEEFKAQIADPEFEGYCHCKLYYKHR